MKFNRLLFVVAFVSLAAAIAYAADPALPAGTASGSISINGKEARLAYATTFVDQKDERKPTILIVSDKKLPSSAWKSDMDLMMSKQKFFGVAFYIDSKGEVYRTEYFDGGPFSTSASGIFDLKLDSRTAKDLVGSATSTEGAGKLTEPVKLDVRFHASR